MLDAPTAVPRKLMSLEVALYGKDHDPHLTDLIHNERFKAVFYAVVPSPGRKYRALEMRFGKGQTFEAIGQILNVHQSNARIYVKKAVRVFAAKVKQQEMVSIIRTPLLKQVA